VDIAKLAPRTSGYTGADIAEVCRKAGRIALRESITAAEVTMPHFEQALEKTPRSVTPELENQYRRLAKNLRGAVRRIGLVPETEEREATP